MNWYHLYLSYVYIRILEGNRIYDYLKTCLCMQLQIESTGPSLLPSGRDRFRVHSHNLCVPVPRVYLPIHSSLLSEPEAKILGAFSFSFRINLPWDSKCTTSRPLPMWLPPIALSTLQVLLFSFFLFLHKTNRNLFRRTVYMYVYIFFC